VFLTVAQEGKSTRNDVLPYQLQKICRSLSTAELLILAAAYEFANDSAEVEKLRERGAMGLPGSTGDWRQYASVKTDLIYEELIAINEEQLIQKKLFSNLFLEIIVALPPRNMVG
jgi:hypothetical protein